jgi:general stress protein CsbA
MIGFIANYKYKIARLQLLLLIFFVGLATQFKTDFIMNWFCLFMAVFSMLMWFSYIQNENLKKKKELY